MGSADGVAGLINMISGGAFSRFSVFAMSITPYITASIVIQLLSMIIPSLERLTKEGGEEGRKKNKQIYKNSYYNTSTSRSYRTISSI